MKLNSTVAALAFVLMGAAWSALSASSMHDLHDLESLVSKAELICEVEVLSKESLLLDDGTIETRYTFSTITPIKGGAASIQEIRIPGGEVAGRGLLIPGMPTYQTGERNILFLSKATQAKNWRLPIGLSAGSFKVNLEASGERMAVRQLHEAHSSAQVLSRDDLIFDIMDEVARQQ
ncbi:MAG: hypothetical protein HN405_01800 [Planctomycetes bacterium]|jgi:hypothetical protein|nr:hypothetical protein [Planctomycetota bacterium]MBT4561082.1 hypothetical protein [Planctomycetota bacterium]MBT5100499.1 hypothetical protein [Planctomycetota bacterium]MBT7012952.1 hypothetical protein [Planctomycetota bacterium]MBT7318800.1 hypothetical protein [Planctomycetota bacterium]